MTHPTKRRRNSKIINPEELAEYTALLSTDGRSAIGIGAGLVIFAQPFGFTIAPTYGPWAPLAMLALAAAGLASLFWEARDIHRDGKSALLHAYVRHMAMIATLGAALTVTIIALTVALQTKLIILPAFLQYGIPRGIVLLLLAVGGIVAGLWCIGRLLYRSPIRSRSRLRP
jgi:hypothetical protein